LVPVRSLVGIATIAGVARDTTSGRSERRREPTSHDVPVRSWVGIATIVVPRVTVRGMTVRGVVVREFRSAPAKGEIRTKRASIFVRKSCGSLIKRAS